MGKASWDFSINIYIFFFSLPIYLEDKTGHEGIQGWAEQCRVWHQRQARGRMWLWSREERTFSRVEVAVGGLGWIGMGFPFFPELLCPADPTATSHPGQEQLLCSPENNRADTDQDPARGERSQHDISNSSGDSSQKFSG